MIPRRMQAKVQELAIITMLVVLLWMKNAHGTEWDCTGAKNTGTFQRSTDCTISGTSTDTGGGVVVSNTLEIAGTVEDMNNLIVITAASKQRHFYVNGVNNKLVLRYVKLTGGFISSYGNFPDRYGGSICIYTSGGTLQLYASILANNKANNYNYGNGYGGAIYANGDQTNINAIIIQIHQTIINNNEASNAAGMYLQYSTCTMVNSTVSGNSLTGAGAGAGMYILDSSVVIRRSVISRNTAQYGAKGGGLYMTSYSKTISTTVEVRESTVSQNQAKYGNEIYTWGAPTISIVNTLFNQPVDSNNNFQKW